MGKIDFQGCSEQEIIAGCIKNETKFQQMLYNQLASKMFAVCLRYANEYNAAQDLMQEAFVKVFRNIEKYRGDGSFEGWVRRIFVNTAIEHYRKQVNMYALHDSETRTFEYYEDNALETLKHQDILKIIQQLSDGYRTVFNLYVIEGYSHKEIGELMGISEGTSKSQLARARYLLQKMIMENSGTAAQTLNA
jgi:RNA polymerase sigma-70 factor (ECF subfamily)